MFNENVEGSGNYNPIGLIRDSYTLVENRHMKMRLKDTSRYRITIPEYSIEGREGVRGGGLDPISQTNFSQNPSPNY